MTPSQLRDFARLVLPHVPKLDRSLRRRWKAQATRGNFDNRQIKALSLITSGAAARLCAARRPLRVFLEQVSYNSRRLAKLNVSPAEVSDTLAGYDRELGSLLAARSAGPRETIHSLLQHLRVRTALAINDAFYQVREGETQAFYGLMRAELDASGFDDLLRRFILILTRTFRAQAGRLIPFTADPQLKPALLRRLSRPRYIEAGSPDEALILDSAIRGVFRSYWSVPFFSDRRLAGLIQFGFRLSYPWLPRELDLLNAFAERCLRAAGRARLIADLAAREQQVRSLAANLLAAEERERSRLGRELHDDAGQSLLFLRLHLELLEKTSPPPLRPKLREARDVTERIIAEIRRIIAALNPSAVEEWGLPGAIRRLSARFRKLYPIRLRLQLCPYPARLPLAQETATYRVVQECYQNIARHSSASRVNLLLHSTDKSLEMTITDNGVGFDMECALAKAGSFGLKGMRERVSLLGGDLQIGSRPGHGTRVTMRWPLSKPQTWQDAEKGFDRPAPCRSHTRACFRAARVSKRDP